MKSLTQIVSLILCLIALTSSAIQTESPRGIVVLEIRDKSGQQVGLYENSYALLIGVSDYTDWPKLPGVKEDIKAVKDALENLGFITTVVEDPDYAHLNQAFSDFINRCGQSENDRLLFYFAGHGHTLKLAYGGEMGYIVPVDAPNPNRDEKGFLSRAMDMQMMEVYARRIQSKHALFVFDSCFSGAIFALSREVPENITYKTAEPVRQFITSGSANERVPDRSIFRQQLLEALSGAADFDGDGYVTGMEIGELLQKNVVNYTRGAQHPQYGKIRDPLLDKGDFVFQISGPETSVIRRLETQATLMVDSDPKGASVYVDGRMVGVTPCEAKVDTGVEGRKTVAVAVSKEGYNTERAEVLLTAGRKADWSDVNLSKIPIEPAIQIPETEEAPGLSKTSPSITGKDGAEMVLIPADEFQMGTDPADIPGLAQWLKKLYPSSNVQEGWFEDESPRHPVYVDAFYMDKYEVTNAQYKKFMDATGYKAPAFWDNEKYNQPEQPVVGVTWHDAVAYCQWAGKRLPTEAEWEKAARGGLVGKKYTWGDAWPPPDRSGNFADMAAKRIFTDWLIIDGYDDGYAYTAPVGKFKPNGYGLYDMSGNVWEWCADWYDGGYYAGSPRSNPKGPGTGSSRVLRGGSLSYYYAYDLRVADRLNFLPADCYYFVGFRGVAQD